MSIEPLLLIGSLLILISIFIAKLTDNLGIPTLILFIGVGMVAGSEGPGGIYFDDAFKAQSIGSVALVFILFAGGLETNWNSVKPVIKESVALATVGVLLTALVIAVFSVYVLNFSWLNGMLLGSVISSTDAAAVFSVLRSRNINLNGNLKPLLELESGSNDPMAIFLTIGLIQFITIPDKSYLEIGLLFVYQMGLGALLGFVFGKVSVYIVNKIKSRNEGVYPVLMLSLAAAIYSSTALVNGSGFLAVYIAGIIIGNSDFVQKKTTIRFFDGFAWLSQISMFLTLGLLVFPSHLVPVIGSGFAVSFALIFLARPVSVFISLAFFKYNWRETIFISWVGLRGAVPIILCTFLLTAKIPHSEQIFNLVFFIVLTSVVIQGWSLPFVAKKLQLISPEKKKLHSPIEFTPKSETTTDIIDLYIPYNSKLVGKSIVEIGIPKDSLITMIIRNEQYIVPSGGTVLEADDTILVLADKENAGKISALISQKNDDVFSEKK